MRGPNSIWKIFFLFLTVWILVVTCAKKKKTTAKTAPPKKEDVEEPVRKRDTSESKSGMDAEKKLINLRDKINKYGVVSLDDDNFKTYSTDRPRDYHAILMFTATAPMYKCGVCGRAKTAFEEVAKAYNSQYNFTTASIENRIAFFRIEVDDARNVFGSLGLESVPRFYHLPPATKESPKMKMETLEIESQSFLQGGAGTLTYLSEITGVKIHVLHDPTLVLVGAGLLALLIALFVTYAHRDLWSTMFFYQTPYLWVVISILCFGVGVSGLIFCVIRSAPPLGYGMRGEVGIFAPQGRDQYSVEGIIVALCTIGCGLSYFLLYWSTKVRFPLLRHVLVILSLTLFMVLSLQLWSAYTSKTLWYSLKDTFPADVWAFFASSVKKQSGLVKRLFRVSELWLVTKDESAFYKKFDGLFVDYVKKTFFSSIFKSEL